jgi:Ca2+-binding EF-hand superfamily protein
MVDNRRKFLRIVILALPAATAAGAFAQQAMPSAQQCAAMWKAADANKDGSLTGQELEKFKATMTKIDTDKDGKISEAEFMAACEKGDLKDVGK